MQNLKHRNVWVVGGKPDWYRGPWIHVGQTPGKKYDNARTNLMAIVESNKISDNFILMNDDFYVMKPQELKPYYSGTLRERLERNERLSPNATYTRKIRETIDLLEARGIEDPLDYSIHVPMVMDKAGLQEALEFPLIRSAYGNLRQVGGEQRQDVKVYTGALYDGLSFDWTQDTDFLSSDDGSFMLLKGKLLAPMFPKPTVFEKVI
jgi:hypothetical protein